MLINTDLLHLAYLMDEDSFSQAWPKFFRDTASPGVNIELLHGGTPFMGHQTIRQTPTISSKLYGEIKKTIIVQVSATSSCEQM